RLVELWTREDVSMLQTAMSLVPALGLIAAPIGGRLGEKRCQISCQAGLIVLGKQDVEAPKAIDGSAQLGLSMQRIKGENRPFDERGGEKWLESADLVLLCLHVDLKKHHACFNIVGAELMNRLGLFARRSHGFAINGYLRMLLVPRRALQATRLVPAALLGFP